MRPVARFCPGLRRESKPMSRAGLHVISHTDLDGVTAAAVAWTNGRPGMSPVRLSLVGYGEVDFLVLDSLSRGEPLVVLDLFCQKPQTVDEIDRSFDAGDPPFFFDHHQSTLERYGNRPWAYVDVNHCAAKVYYRWLMHKAAGGERNRLSRLEGIVEIANDRDLWLNKIPESRLWQALVTLCGPWAVLTRLIEDPSPELSPGERSFTEAFVQEQERRFGLALEKALRSGEDLLFVGPGALEFGDVSDFCGLILDRMESPPRLVAVLSRRPAGDWAASLRSREGFAGRVTGLLRDGRKVRGGGHDDSAGLYFPPHYRPEEIRDSLISAVRSILESDAPSGLSLGDLLKQAMEEKK
jgi:hypothetical protein